MDGAEAGLKPRKLDRSARLAPVLRITAVAGPLRGPPTQEAAATRHFAVTTTPHAPADADHEPPPDQDELRSCISEISARLPSSPIAAGSACSSPGQRATAEAAEEVQLWAPVPVPRLVAALKALQARRHLAIVHGLPVVQLGRFCVMFNACIHTAMLSSAR